MSDEEIEAIFCPQCATTMKMLFGNRSIHILANKKKQMFDRLTKIKNLVRDGKSKREINEALRINRQQLYYYLKLIERE